MLKKITLPKGFITIFDEWLHKYTHLIILVCSLCTIALFGYYHYATIKQMDTAAPLLLLLLSFSLFAITAAYICLKKGWPIQRVFLIAYLSLGFIYMGIFGPMKVPDEPYHYIQAYRYSDMLLGDRVDGYWMDMRTDDAQFFEQANANCYELKGQYETIRSEAKLLCQEPALTWTEVPIGVFNISTNSPQVKLPAALGITLARLMGLGAYPLFYLGRIFNCLFFALLAYFAIKITPRGKMAFAGISLLPITLHVTSSYSYDAGTLGLALLLAAFCFQGLFGRGQIRKGTAVGILITTFLLAPCKKVYVVVALMALFIPQNRFSSARKGALFKIAVLGCIALSLLFFQEVYTLQLAMISPENLITPAGESGGIQSWYRPLSWWLSNPVDMIEIFVATFSTLTDNYIQSFFGGNLSWLTLPGPWFIVIAFLLLMLASLFVRTEPFQPLRSPSDPPTEMAIRPSVRLASLLLLVVGILGIFLAMLTDAWFSAYADGYTLIYGVQGRYFLPLLPLAFLVLHGTGVSLPPYRGKLILLAFIALNLAYAVRLFATMVLL